MTNPIRPVGHTVLVLLDPVETTTESGIITVTEAQLDRAEMRQTEGIVVAIGAGAWSDRPAPYCKVGDRILFPQFSGQMRRVVAGDRTLQYRIINDLDVKAIIEE